METHWKFFISPRKKRKRKQTNPILLLLDDHCSDHSEALSSLRSIGTSPVLTWWIILSRIKSASISQSISPSVHHSIRHSIQYQHQPLLPFPFTFHSSLFLHSSLPGHGAVRYGTVQYSTVRYSTKTLIFFSLVFFFSLLFL